MEAVRYEAPQVTEIGSVHDLTLVDKGLLADDGFTLQGVPIGVVGPPAESPLPPLSDLRLKREVHGL